MTSLAFGLVGIIVNMTGGVRYTYLAAAGVCLINILLVFKVDEHKFNRDHMVEERVGGFKKAA